MDYSKGKKKQHKKSKVNPATNNFAIGHTLSIGGASFHTIESLSKMYLRHSLEDR